MKGITDNCRLILQSKSMQDKTFCIHQLKKIYNTLYRTNITTSEMDGYIHPAYKKKELLSIDVKPCDELNKKHMIYKFYKVMKYKSMRKQVIKTVNKEKPNKLVEKKIYLCPHCNKEVII